MDEGGVGTEGLWMSILTYPRFFEGRILEFVWGNFDPPGVAFLKRLLLLWPALALLFTLWAAVPNVLSLIVRARRTEYIVSYLLCWWDLGKSLASFWGGFLKLFALILGTALGIVRVFLAGLWLLVQDILLAPVRLVA